MNRIILKARTSMLELAKLIHEAIGIESPRKFIAVCALFGAVVFMGLGWLIDKGYRVKLKEQSHPAIQNTTYGQQSPIIPNNRGSVTISSDGSKPKQPPPPPKDTSK